MPKKWHVTPASHSSTLCKGGPHHKGEGGDMGDWIFYGLFYGQFYNYIIGVSSTGNQSD